MSRVRGKGGWFPFVFVIKDRLNFIIRKVKMNPLSQDLLLKQSMCGSRLFSDPTYRAGGRICWLCVGSSM